jgi:hypothetical protein
MYIYAVVITNCKYAAKLYFTKIHGNKMHMISFLRLYFIIVPVFSYTILYLASKLTLRVSLNSITENNLRKTIFKS